MKNDPSATSGWGPGAQEVRREEEENLFLSSAEPRRWQEVGARTGMARSGTACIFVDS